MSQTAPGRYESSFALDQYGSFVLRASTPKLGDNGELKPFASSYGHVTNPIRASTRASSPTSIAEACRAGRGGTLRPKPSDVFKSRH